MSSNHQLITLLETHAPIIMGIVNATPDSFYDGGQPLDAIKHCIDDMQSLNVDIIDLGAESSRPGAQPISSTEEIDRLRDPLLHASTHTTAVLSVDTYKPETAEFALTNGASIINDITGGESDDLLHVIAKHNGAIVLMHKQGAPSQMQKKPSYENVIDDIYHYLAQQIQKVQSFGITTIMIDPGIGFGKTLEHNLLILKHLDRFRSLKCPLLIGTSNKSFIGQLTHATVDERVPGSIASAIACYEKGAQIFRVHNVKETQQAFDVFRAIHE